jgi:hypothetical protein
LFLGKSLQYIAGTGNVGEVDLGLDAVALARRGFGTRAVALTLLLEVGTDFFRFVGFEGAGMGFLSGDAGHYQSIQNRLAFDFQLSRQIVNSNLAHPPLHSS